MFTVKIHHPADPKMVTGYQGLGDEEVLGNVISVRRQYGSTKDKPLPGLHIEFEEGSKYGGMILNAGRVYVMNEQGATVASYILDMAQSPS